MADKKGKVKDTEEIHSEMETSAPSIESMDDVPFSKMLKYLLTKV